LVGQKTDFKIKRQKSKGKSTEGSGFSDQGLDFNAAAQGLNDEGGKLTTKSTKLVIFVVLRGLRG